MTTAQPPVWSRFAKWPPLPARLLLLALLAIVVAAALVPINSGKTSVRTTNAIAVLVKDKAETRETARYEDLALYDRVIARIAMQSALIEARRWAMPWSSSAMVPSSSRVREARSMARLTRS